MPLRFHIEVTERQQGADPENVVQVLFTEPTGLRLVIRKAGTPTALSALLSTAEVLALQACIHRYLEAKPKFE